MEKITYDPAKKYSWTPEDTFTLSGAEFGLVLNALRAILNSQEAARILIANQANTTIEDILGKAVEAGVVKEETQEETQA